MKVVIDAGRCNGHGRCYSLAPALFDADDSGRGVVVGDEVAADQLDAARAAIANCPELAITIADHSATQH
ncbi:MAG: ferredoxin [Ilumatobacteraceae bacterium]|nr:ferredoxin [Ilumatobacteraceae bacterium]MCU1389585.1 ferredoxin [Ilumatobacteraceae bacterium]